MKHTIIYSLLITVCSLFTLNAVAQKCEVKQDPITNEKTCQFKNNANTLRYEYTGGATVDFFATFNYNGEQNVAIPQGSKIIFKLANDSIVTLISLGDAAPQTKVQSSQYGTSVYTQYTLPFKLSRQQVATLASAKIVFMRYPATDGGTLDYDVKGMGKIYPNKITKGAKCMDEHMDTFK